jgi:ribosomal protein S18 acetylase RimI-like enzyme
MSYTIRPATPADNEALIRCELNSPLDLGSVSLRFDRGPDYFAQDRLREHAVVMVAEDGDRIVGIMGGTYHHALVDGRLRTLLYIHQGRIPPEHQRRGIGGALAAAVSRWAEEQGAKVDSTYWYIAPSNRRSIAFGSRTSRPWSVDAYLHYVPTESTPSQVIPIRPLGQRDLPRLVELINRTRNRQELFVPYTEESFLARISRSPDYTWRNLYGLEEAGALVAVAGVWDTGRSLRTIEEDHESGTVRTRSEVTVLDYGFAEGRADAWRTLFLGLLDIGKAWGRTGLQFTAPPSDEAFQTVADFPVEFTVFKLFTPRIPEPPGAAQHGIYVDPVYV